MAKTVVFDFDGVIHSYTSGWQGEDAIPDPPVPGIREALKEIHDAGYEVVVVSTRCATAKGKGAIEAWLYNNGLREYIDKVCKEKPPEKSGRFSLRDCVCIELLCLSSLGPCG